MSTDPEYRVIVLGLLCCVTHMDTYGRASRILFGRRMSAGVHGSLALRSRGRER